MKAGKPGIRVGRVARVSSVLAIFTPACIEFTPFDANLDEDERNQTAKNLSALAAMDPPPAEWRFAAIADSHGKLDGLCEVVDHLNGMRELSFVVHLGDLSDVGLRQEYQWTLRCLRRLNVPFFAVIGNHDALSNGKAVYSSMFGPYDFNVDYGGIRLVCFNSNHLEFEGYPDLNWLEEASAPSDQFSLVLGATHRPPVGGDYADVLRRNGVRGVLTAHLHEFGRYDDGRFSVVGVDDAGAGRFLMVEVRAEGFEVETCSVDGCAPGAP